jgi:hypothetical protein
VWLEKNKGERLGNNQFFKKEALQWNRAVCSRRRALYLQRREKAKYDRIRNV